MMSTITLELEDILIKLLKQLDQPVERAAKELIVLELYRRALLSTGKAAEILGMPLLDFIQHSGRLGIPYFRLSDDELEAEIRASRNL